MRTRALDRWRSRGGAQGFTLIEVLLTVAVVTAVMVPVLGWTIVALDRSGDSGATDDTTAFAQVSRFLTRDVATAELVSARQPGQGTALPPATCGDASPVWLRTTDADVDVFYVTVDRGDMSELLRRECRGGVLVSEATVAEGLQDVTPPNRGTTTTSVPVQPVPVGVQCENRSGISAAVDPCGVVVLTLQGAKSTEVTLRAERRLTPDASGDLRPLPQITCDPESCSGFRGAGGLFEVAFDGSLSTAPKGIESYAWSFYDPVNPSVVLPTTGVPESADPSTEPISFPCSPTATPLSWRADAGRGRPGCVFEVQLTIRENGGSEYTATRSVLIENASPEIQVVPDPVEAFRTVPVQFSTQGTIDPDGGTLTYEWDFGDGSPGDTTANPSHVYPCPINRTLPCRYTTVLRVSDEFTTVERSIPVTVSNAPPRLGISGPTAFSRLNETLTWRATDPDDASNINAGPWDPDGNANRNGRYDFQPNEMLWKLVDVDGNPVPGVPAAGVTGRDFSYTFTQFGLYLLTLSVTDADGQKVETSLELRVNNPPVARAAIGKGTISSTNPTGLSEKVYSSGNTPADDPIQLDSTRSFDPDDGPIVSRKWRVWQQGSTRPSGDVFPTCNASASNLPCEFADTSVADTDGRYLFTPNLAGWTAGRYRLVLVVADDNLSENDCAIESPWSTCRQGIAGNWWVPLRINAKPNVTGITYASAPGSFPTCATPPINNIVCRTTSYTFSPLPATPTDPDSSGALTYRWEVPFTVGTVLGGPNLNTAFPSTVPVTPTGPNGTIRLIVTDVDGGSTTVTLPLRLRNHPPATSILVDANADAQQATGSWTTNDPVNNPYTTGVSLVGGDPDGDIVLRRWTFERRNTATPNAPVSPAERVTIEAVRSGSTWTCTTTPSGGTPSMTFTSPADPPGCAKIVPTITAYGLYRVTAFEQDNSGDTSQDTRDLLVLRPAVADIRVTAGGGTNSCQINTGSLLPRSGNLVSLGNVSTSAPCFDARGSTEGNGGAIRGYFWTFPSPVASPFREWQIFTFSACTNYQVGASLEGCYRYPVTLTVLNQANFPTPVTVWVRFNAQPIARADKNPASTTNMKTAVLANGNVITRIPACNGATLLSFPAQSCAIDLVGLGSPDPLNLSFDPDGNALRTGAAPVPPANYSWSYTGVAGVTSSIDTTTVASRFRVNLSAPSTYSNGSWGTARLTVTDDESYSSAAPPNNSPRTISGVINRAPVLGTSGNAFQVGRSSQVLPQNQSAPIQLVVPEAADPGQNGACSSLSDSLDTLWQRIPGALPGEQTASEANYEWTVSQVGRPDKVVRGVTRVDCVFNALGGTSAGTTIVSSPPVLFDYVNLTQVTVTARVTDSDGDVSTVSQALTVRDANPTAVIEPVTSAPSNTPAAQTCQLYPSSNAVSSRCSVYSDSPVQPRTFTLSGASSTTGAGLPASNFSWRLFDGPGGSVNGVPQPSADVTSTLCTGTTGAQFSCTVGANRVYRAELTVTDGARTATTVYYVKLNRRPVVTLTPVSGLTINRGVATAVTCTVTDGDSFVNQRRWELLDVNGAVLVSQNDPASPCTFTVPLTAAPGPVTFRYIATDVEGASNQTPPIVYTVNNQNPTTSVSLTANGTPCPPANDPCVRNPDVSVDLASTSTDPDGTFAPPVWTVRNPSNQVVAGLIPDGADPQPVTLSTPGVWTFTVTVTDNDGGIATATRTVRVNGGPTGTSDAEGTVSINGQVVTDTFASNEQAPFDLTFAAADWTDPDSPLTYRWTLTGPADGANPGDSLSADGQSVTLRVPLFGDYTITLEVTDSLGLTTTTTRDVVFNARPEALVEVRRNGAVCAGANQASGCVVNSPVDVEVRGSGNDVDGTVAGYEWSVRRPGSTSATVEGTTQNLDISSIVDSVVGEYIVSLVVIDNNGLRSLPQAVLVFHNPPPTASFDPGTLDVPRQAPFDVNVNAQDTSPRPTTLTLLWQVFQDGSLVFERETSSNTVQLELDQSLVDLGPATLEVTVFDADGGRSATVSRALNIVNAAPLAQIESSPTSTTSSSATQTWSFFSVTDDPDGTVAKIWWQVLDSSGNLVAGEATEPATGVTPDLSYLFTVPDTYTVNLFVRDDLGALGQDTIEVILNTPPTACIQALPGDPVAGLAVLFNASCSSGNDTGDSIVDYAWSADGPGPVVIDTTSAGASEATPQVTFSVVGTYNVRLTVTDARDGVSQERLVSVRVVNP
jgi:hypothetical protein